VRASFRRALWLVVSTVATVAGDAVAQDTTRVRPDSILREVPLPPPVPAPPADTAESLKQKPPVTPMGAMWRSILIPGWGQARLNRKLTGALFIAWEGVTLGMSIKTSNELSYMDRTNSAGLSAKRKERQDWLVLLAFNHLFSAIEAYVSAHLWDFPSDLEIRAAPVPGGGAGASVTLPFRVP
jgi:hypothetical protein